MCLLGDNMSVSKINNIKNILNLINKRVNFEFRNKYKCSRYLNALGKFMNENNDNDILFFKETIYHDGYDKYGPKSDIYDIHIVKENEDGCLIYQNWHGEDWYDSDFYFDKYEEYELTNSSIMVRILKADKILNFKNYEDEMNFKNSKFVERDMIKYGKNNIYVGTDVNNGRKVLRFLSKINKEFIINNIIVD